MGISKLTLFSPGAGWGMIGGWWVTWFSLGLIIGTYQGRFTGFKELLD